jgi:multiple sugar transport system substrate-binding protein
MALPLFKHPRARHLLLLLIMTGLTSSGCQDPAANLATKPEAEPTLHVTVTDDPELATAIARQWKARAGSKIIVTNISTAQLLDSKRLQADLIIYPSAQLGHLATKQTLLPLQKYLNETLSEHNKGLLPTASKAEVSWGPQRYAASLGSPQLMLYYRRDIFEALNLKPPETWSDYQQLVSLLSDRNRVSPWIPTDQEAWKATAEPLGPGWAAITLLARAAAYARHPNQYSGVFDYLSMEPLIAGAPFVRALEELEQAATSSPGKEWTTSPTATRQQFYQGQAAMALSWPSLGASNQHEEATAKPVPVAWALLPGSRDIYNASDQTWETLPGPERAHVPLLAISGRLGSISRNSRHPRFAADSLVRLTSTKWSASVSRRSRFTAMFRSSHLSDPIPWMDIGTSPTAADQFAAIYQQAHAGSRVMFCLRIPGHARYLQELDQAVARVLSREASAQDALLATARQWEAITKELGREEQGQAYRQSLGLEP